MFNPKYRITDKILSDLTKISEIKSLVEKSNILPAREIFLKKVATVGMAHSSTSIEGNTLNEYQVEKLAKGEKVSAEAREILEVKNYLQALKLVDKIHESRKPLDEKVILDVHKSVITGLIDENKVGVFRRGPVYIVNVSADENEELVYTPPKFDKVEPLIDELIKWMNKKDDIHPIIKAGIFHYQFVSIHPFPDGNGRSTRLLTLLYLYQSGYVFKKSLVLEDFYNNNRKRYYENLQTGKSFDARENADLTGWLEYFTEGFLFEVQRVKDLILSSSDKSSKQIILNKDELKIVDFTLNLGKITSDDAVDILGIPKRTAQDKLKKLVNL
ncbi:MAG: Fic family protein, partial [Candidatus Woesebacteria bacterium]|nr:Fic family protein [Candidatus Woesebacteria bacterium]